MMIGARTAAWAKSGGWVNPYVTDGLIAMWDGEWNAGGGVHDQNATVWKDLIGGGFDWNLTGSASWGGNALICSGKSAVNYDGLSLSIGYQIELLCSGVGTDYRCVINLDKVNLRNSFVLYRNVNYMTPGGAYNGFPSAGVGMHLWSASVVNPLYAGTNWQKRFGNYHLDGFPVQNESNGNWAGTWKADDYSDYASIGILNLNGSDIYPYTGQINTIRVYNRTLLSSEVAANYAIDKARFGLT